MIVAWQGWRIEVPDRWNPVKLEGDASAGYLLMADLHRPRLGIRWKQLPSKRLKAEATVKKVIAGEVGVLAAEEVKSASPSHGEWRSPLLYQDKEPPGRDVWAGYSPRSDRLFELVYHAHRRDNVLVERVLPTLCDAGPEGPKEWSIFELSCRVPQGLGLAGQRLNAGDLALMFESKGARTVVRGRKARAVTVRQIAIAKLALQRRPIEKWIAEQASWRGRGKLYKLQGAAEELNAGPKLVQQKTIRRRRFGWMVWTAPGHTVLAKHDEVHDRLVLVDATDEALAREVLESVGWAREK